MKQGALAKTNLARIPPIHTLHLLHQPKPQPLIDPQIRLPLGTLQVTRHALCIRPARHRLHQPASHPHPPHLRTHRDHIAEVVPSRAGPELRVRARLQSLPDPVPADVQPPAAAEADVVDELAE